MSHHLWNETSHLLILIYWAWILAIRRDTQDIQWNLTTWADAANVCNERMKHRFRPSSLQLGGRKLCLRNGSHGSPQWWTMPRRQWRNAIRWDSVLKALSTTEAENILGKWNGSICGQKRHKRNSLKLNYLSGCCERMQRTDATSWVVPEQLDGANLLSGRRVALVSSCGCTATAFLSPADESLPWLFGAVRKDMLVEDLPESMLAKDAMASTATRGQKSHSWLQENKRAERPLLSALKKIFCVEELMRICCAVVINPCYRKKKVWIRLYEFIQYTCKSLYLRYLNNKQRIITLNRKQDASRHRWKVSTIRMTLISEPSCKVFFIPLGVLTSSTK